MDDGPAAMTAWLTGVLDDLHEQAGFAPTPGDRAAEEARVAAERMIVELHKPWNGGGRVTFCSEFEHDEQEFPCPTLCWLAYGHRFDAPGYRAEWAPGGARPATG